MTPPRIAPLQPPYDADTEETLRKWMPPGADVEPLALFRTLAVDPALAARMRPLGAHLLAHGRLAVRDRELVILRVCALAGAEYEWGVHAVAFARPAGLTDAEVAATVSGDPLPAARDDLLLRLADELHANATISDALWPALAQQFAPEEILELLALCGWYRLIASICTSAGVPLEPWAERFG